MTETPSLDLAAIKERPDELRYIAEFLEAKFAHRSAKRLREIATDIPALLARIETLENENIAWKARYDDMAETHMLWRVDVSRAATKIASLESLLAKAGRALEPFAKWSDWHGGMLLDDENVAHGRANALGGAPEYILLSDLRAARAALTEIEGGEK